MRWSSSPPSRPAHHPPSPRLPTWIPLLLLVSLLSGAACVGASASADAQGSGPGSGSGRDCGTQFRDPASSALLADVVLEGRIRQKMTPTQGEGAAAAAPLYNVTIQVRKKILKGAPLVNGGTKPRKLLIGTFSAQAPSAPKRYIGDEDGGGGEVLVHGVGGRTELVTCVGDVEEGATYIFFLREVGDRKGKYFHISALPVKKNRRLARTVNKILKKNAAKTPEIQRLKGPKSVTKGASLTLRCKGKAKPNPVFTWYRNGEVIVSAKGQRIKNNKRGSRLKISKVAEDQDGVYTCTATNAVGSASKNVTIKVTVPQHQHRKCEKQTFCFNGGTCRYIPALQKTFCQCPKEWAGSRCELLDLSSIHLRNKVSREATLLYERTLIIIGLVVGLLVFVVICIASYFLAKRQRKKLLAKRERRRLMGKKRGSDADTALLDAVDGNGRASSQPSPRSRLLVQKETQTDAVFPPPPHDPPATTLQVEQHQPVHNNLRSSFPLIEASLRPVTAATAPTSQPANPGARPPRPLSDKLPSGLERRGSRSRLKAVSVDDNCAERPSSWKGGSVPDSQSMPVIADNPDSAEALEVGEKLPVSHTAPELSHSQLDPAVNPLPDFPDMVPIVMESPPKDNAHAQLRTPPADAPAVPPRDYAAGRPPGLESADPEALPVNGVLEDYESEEEDFQPLPALHISEDDLNGNVSKSDSFPSPPPPELNSAPHPPLGQNPALQLSLNSGSEEESGGFLPHGALSSPETNSPDGPSPDLVPQYAFDPNGDSDPNEFEPFMHGSPKKGVRRSGGFPNSGGAEQADHERRLYNVRADQDPIPI